MLTEKQDRGLVLIVEDDPDFSYLLSSLLGRRGFRTARAYDGVEALEHVKRSRPDLVTLDLQMPNKAGTLFYRQMKSRPDLREVPVIVITGLTRISGDPENVVRSLLLSERLPPPFAFMEKPCDLRRLFLLVDQAVNGAKSEA
ncbi:MAG: response regulator [Planctomycetes bacterium]|nr:response regulator [Planctomycetota bacterium]